MTAILLYKYHFSVGGLVVMDKHLVRELLTARKAVKDKYTRLKADVAESDYVHEQQYKPITQPLKELLADIKSERVKQEPSSFGTPKKRQSSTPTHNPTFSHDISEIPLDTFEDTTLGRRRHHSLHEPQTPSLHSRSDSSVDINDSSRHLSDNPSIVDLDDYYEQFQGLAKEYIKGMLTKPQDYEHTYGVRFNADKKRYYIGDSIFDFNGENIVIESPSGKRVTYNASKGLYELLFKKTPVAYTTEDLVTFREILLSTNAARRHYDPRQQIQGTGKKYSNIIKPLLYPTTWQESPSSSKEGKGLRMLKFNNKRLEFVPWKDPNKLVQWLRTLLSSKSAGHTGHNNEIVYIIDELRSARIIK